MSQQWLGHRRGYSNIHLGQQLHPPGRILTTNALLLYWAGISEVLGGSCWTTGCVQGQKNFSPDFSISSLVFILAWVFLLLPLLYTFLGFAMQMPSTALQPRIPPSHFHPVFLNVVCLRKISPFSLGLMAPFSLFYRCFFNIMDFLAISIMVSLECCWLFLFITRCSNKACSSQISPLQFSTLP